MPGRSLRLSLPLLAALLFFTQCEVLRDLTTERTGTTHTSGGSSTSSPARRVADKEMLLRQDIIAFAQEQVGTRYKYAGRTPRQGFDCSGFTHYVMGNFDLRISPSSRAQENEGKKIKVSEAQPGDLIFFRRSRNGAVFHVALVVSNDREGLKVVHSTSRGVVVDNIYDSKYWKPKISTARDVVGR